MVALVVEGRTADSLCGLLSGTVELFVRDIELAEEDGVRPVVLSAGGVGAIVKDCLELLPNGDSAVHIDFLRPPPPGGGGGVITPGTSDCSSFTIMCGKFASAESRNVNRDVRMTSSSPFRSSMSNLGCMRIVICKGKSKAHRSRL